MEKGIVVCDHHTWCHSCSHHVPHFRSEECDTPCAYVTHRDAECTEPTTEKRMMECERFLNGEINCGVCAHAWREANLEDCDEGCDADHNDIFFEADPGTDCPDWTPRALSRSAGGEA